ILDLIVAGVQTCALPISGGRPASASLPERRRPRGSCEAAFALGATRWQVVRRVVLPQAWSGILTGSILSISRGAGETAPILFTGARKTACRGRLYVLWVG